jgi:hypothetical protein
MCLDCGCHLPNEDHGDGNHITYNTLARAAKASGISPKKALKNMKKTLKVAKDSVDAAVTEQQWPVAASKKPAPPSSSQKPPEHAKPVVADGTKGMQRGF